MPGRGSLGGSPNNDDMSGRGALLPLGPTPAPSGLTVGGRERGRSTGTNTPPTITAEGNTGRFGGGDGRCDNGGGGGRGRGGSELKKGDVGGGCWWRCDGGV